MRSDSDGEAQEQSTPDMHTIQELATKAGCVIHHYPHHYVAVVEDIWPNGDDSTQIGERKPFVQVYPDTARGYQAMYSALACRFPALATPFVQCAVCGQSKPYAEFVARYLGKNMRKLCRECRKSENRAANERYKRLEAERQAKEEHEKAALDAARKDYTLRYPMREYRFSAARTVEELHHIAYELENERAIEDEWQNYCLSLGFNTNDMQRIAGLHAGISYHREQWNTAKELFLALDPPYYGTSGRGRTRVLHEQEMALLYSEQEGRCAYCGIELLPLAYRKFRTRIVRARDLPDWDGVGDEMALKEINVDRMAHVEHRIPVARGGSDDKSNLALACRACNLRKGARTDDEFAQIPEDAISQLFMTPLHLWEAMEYERRGYTRFTDDTMNLRIFGSIRTTFGNV